MLVGPRTLNRWYDIIRKRKLEQRWATNEITILPLKPLNTKKEHDIWR
jgi:hypothetical protein